VTAFPLELCDYARVSISAAYPKIKAAKIGGVAVLVLLLLFAALGPGKLQYRTGLGWQIDHVVGYFVFTMGFWFVWPRPFIIGGALMLVAMLLEALQAVTPDRHCDLQGVLYSVGGVLIAALVAHLLTKIQLKVLTRIRLVRASRPRPLPGAA
jgi:hypothetical protein